MMFSGRCGIVGKEFVFSLAGSLKGAIGKDSEFSGVWAGERCVGRSRRTQTNDAWKRGERKVGASVSESARTWRDVFFKMSRYIKNFERKNDTVLTGRQGMVVETSDREEQHGSSGCGAGKVRGGGRR
jgi:hypothetical protein